MVEEIKKTTPQIVKLGVAPAPHLAAGRTTTRRMMLDVLIGLLPVIVMSAYVFHWYAGLQVGICVLSCLVAEWLFMRMRGRRATLHDFSAAVTGMILAFSLPWSSPWYIGVVGSFAAIGIGKVVYGGLGQNIFNPAMVGRAFVMIAFSIGAAVYVGDSPMLGKLVSQATPLTQARSGDADFAWPLLIGTHNGSLGETSVLACLLGGLYLCLRRSASWQIPVSMIGAVWVLAGISHWASPSYYPDALFELTTGALVFGAFFIATDPVTSPLTPRGKIIFGLGIGVLTWIIRRYSGYPEGVMFAVLIMNSLVPMINRWSIPTPVGGPVPVKEKS